VCGSVLQCASSVTNSKNVATQLHHTLTHLEDKLLSVARNTHLQRTCNVLTVCFKCNQFKKDTRRPTATCPPSVLQCVASMLQCVASVTQTKKVFPPHQTAICPPSMLQCIANISQCFKRVLQCVASATKKRKCTRHPTTICPRTSGFSSHQPLAKKM